MTPELAGAMHLESVPMPRGHRRTRRILALLGLTVASLAYAVATGWGALALFYLAPGSATARTALAWAFVALGLIALVALAVRRARRPAVGAFVMAFVLALISGAGQRRRTTATGNRRWPYCRTPPSTGIA